MRIPISAFCMLLAANLSAAAQERVWNFDVYLDDARIGYHRFALAGPDAGRELKTQARFNVKVLFFEAYRYVHDATERWRGDCLVNLVSSTDDNGKKLSVDAAGESGDLTVRSTRGGEALKGCVMSYAYWNPAILRQSRLLNSQTGEYDAVKIEFLGEGRINVRGAATAANHYRIAGIKQPVDLWYSASGEWLALASNVQSGRQLRYQLN